MPAPMFERFLAALISWAEPVQPYSPEDRPCTGKAKLTQEDRVKRLRERLGTVITAEGASADDIDLKEDVGLESSGHDGSGDNDFELKEDVDLGPDSGKHPRIDDDDDDGLDEFPESEPVRY